MAGERAEIARLNAKVERFQRAAVVGAILMLALIVAGFVSRSSARFAELEVERLDVVNPDGRPALTIAGAGRLPGPMMNGKQYPQTVSGGREQAAGMIFFNDQGDEVGGLIYHGEPSDSSYEAVGHLSFDQWKQDQVLALQYLDDGRHRRAGINIWDRSTTLDIGELLDLAQARAEAATSAERDSVERAIQGLAQRHEPGVHRVFLGSMDRTATLLLRDTEGRVRLRLYVDSMDVARLEFLDDSGDVVHGVPD